MDKLSIDFETRSEVDLKTAGIYNYASSLDTEILMMGYAFNDDPPEVWLPDQPFPQRIKDHIRKGFDLHAFNAQFERLVWAYILSQDFDDIPNPTLRQWKCTAAQARVHGLPKKLGDAARCLGLPMQKMSEGTRLLKAYSAPGHTKDIPPDDLALLVEYCATDVEVERMLGQCLRELTDEEWEVFWINEEINDRGLPIDVSLTRAATKYGDAVRLEADARIVASTQGAVLNARKRKTRDDWLSLRLTDAQDAILREDGKIKFGKPLREELLLCDDLDPNVREFVMAVEEAGGATISKYEAFTNRSMDGRLYGAFMYAGGGQTGRFCIAENETIFVLRFGKVINLPIQDLELSDLVWDGEAFVEHEGLVFSGYKEVMTYDGITATPDHKVYTQTQGKVTLEEASQRGYALQVSGMPDPDKIQLGRSGMSDSDYQAVEDSASV